jgi:hypothetical protein
MASLAGLEPGATCTLLDREVKSSSGLSLKLASFLASLQLGNAAQV